MTNGHVRMPVFGDHLSAASMGSPCGERIDVRAASERGAHLLRNVDDDNVAPVRRSRRIRQPDAE
jgi:hypothetical protein